MDKDKAIKQAFEHYARETLQLSFYATFWKRYIDNAQKEYLPVFKSENKINASLFTSRSRQEQYWQILTSDYIKSVTVSDLQTESKKFNSFIAKSVLTNFHILFEGFLYELIWIAFFPSMKRPTNEKKRKKLRDKVIESYDKPLKHRNNNWLHKFLSDKSDERVKSFFQTKVSHDFELTYSDLLELLTLLRNTYSHNLTLDQDDLNSLKSNPKTNSYLLKHVDIEKIGDHNTINIKEDSIKVIIEHAGELLSNLTRLTFNKSNFEFLGMQEVKL